ncbi:short subunit fatty acids transporter [Cytobacillus purgationiresistens]|uniref:Short subunit fatty acids transporter n=1 Tax=Cytobacillus purgationiresistens TaxID=863449 RepID=A0ABU0AL87_9BACI|nr:short subunit fatty acids transporter [Cytobacillus purgationiresistens]
MLNRMANRFSKLVEKYLPDAFVIAVLLTLFVFVVAFFMKPADPLSTFKSFGNGFWSYLTFTMQMILLLMTGMALAAVPFIQRFLTALASKAQTANQLMYLPFLSLLLLII